MHSAAGLLAFVDCAQLCIVERQRNIADEMASYDGHCRTPIRPDRALRNDKDVRFRVGGQSFGKLNRIGGCVKVGPPRWPSAMPDCRTHGVGLCSRNEITEAQDGFGRADLIEHAAKSSIINRKFVAEGEYRLGFSHVILQLSGDSSLNMVRGFWGRAPGNEGVRQGQSGMIVVKAEDLTGAMQLIAGRKIAGKRGRATASCAEDNEIDSPPHAPRL